jgi:GTPase SAR1 family protein
MNFKKIGRKIAKIVNTNGKNPKVIYLSDQDIPDNDKNYFRELTLGKDERLQLLPDTRKYEFSGKNYRDNIFVVGKSGSGKSFWVKQYMIQYNKTFPHNPIYLFSVLDNDDYKEVRNLYKIEIDERIVSDPLAIEDFSGTNGCLICYDDVDTIRDKHIKKELLRLRTSVLEVGRHENINFIYISHGSCKGEETKSIIQESNIKTLYPRGGNQYGRLFKEYMGFNNKQIKALKKIKSRWITICSDYPEVILSEKQIMSRDYFDDLEL